MSNIYSRQRLGFLSLLLAMALLNLSGISGSNAAGSFDLSSEGESCDSVRIKADLNQQATTKLTQEVLTKGTYTLTSAPCHEIIRVDGQRVDRTVTVVATQTISVDINNPSLAAAPHLSYEVRVTTKRLPATDADAELEAECERCREMAEQQITETRNLSLADFEALREKLNEMTIETEKKRTADISKEKTLQEGVLRCENDEEGNEIELSGLKLVQCLYKSLKTLRGDKEAMQTFYFDNVEGELKGLLTAGDEATLANVKNILTVLKGGRYPVAIQESAKNLEAYGESALAMKKQTAAINAINQQLEGLDPNSQQAVALRRQRDSIQGNLSATQKHWDSFFNTSKQTLAGMDSMTNPFLTNVSTSLNEYQAYLNGLYADTVAQTVGISNGTNTNTNGSADTSNANVPSTGRYARGIPGVLENMNQGTSNKANGSATPVTIPNEGDPFTINGVQR